MDLINNIRNSIKDNDFKVVIYNKYIDVINYENINEISDDTIILNNKKLFIIGDDLKIIKLLDREILVEGKINKVEFR